MNRLNRSAFWRGFRRALPLWAGTMPFTIVYAVTARSAGFSPAEIQLMSLLMYSGAAQLSLVTLAASGTPALTILLTVAVLNIHHVLYGMSLAERLKLSRTEKSAAAFLLTDSVYGLVLTEDSADGSFLVGVEISLYLAWNLFTAVGIVLANQVVNPAALHLDFIAPLMFAILLVMTVKSRADTGITILAGSLTLVCLMTQAGSLTLPVAVMAAALIGAWWVGQQTARKLKQA